MSIFKRSCAALFLVSASACSGNSTALSPSPTPPPASPTIQTLNYAPTVIEHSFASQDVDIPSSDVRMTADLRWTDSSKNLDLFWTNALCVFVDGDFAGTGCQIVTRSISDAGTQEAVAGPAAAGSTVRLFVINYGGSPEPTTLAVNLQR